MRTLYPPKFLVTNSTAARTAKANGRAVAVEPNCPGTLQNRGGSAPERPLDEIEAAGDPVLVSVRP